MSHLAPSDTKTSSGLSGGVVGWWQGSAMAWWRSGVTAVVPG